MIGRLQSNPDFVFLRRLARFLDTFLLRSNRMNVIRGNVVDDDSVHVMQRRRRVPLLREEGMTIDDTLVLDDEDETEMCRQCGYEPSYKGYCMDCYWRCSDCKRYFCYADDTPWIYMHRASSSYSQCDYCYNLEALRDCDLTKAVEF